MGKWHRVVYNPTESLKTQQSKLQLIIYIMDYKQKDILHKFSTHKVELNLDAELKSDLAQLSKLMNDMHNLFKEINKKRNTARPIAKELLKKAEKGQEMLDELGIRDNDFRAHIGFAKNSIKDMTFNIPLDTMKGY